MTDDFDKNHWLPNDDDSGDESEDDVSFDWLQGESGDEPAKPTGDHTGVTGELTWLQGFDSAPDSEGSGDDDLSLDWLADAPPQQEEEPQYSGQPQEPSWMTNVHDRLEDQLSDMEEVGTGALEPSWLQGADADFDDVSEEAFDDPASVFGESPAFDEVAFEEPTYAADVPEWLRESDTSSDEPETFGHSIKPQARDDVPDWVLQSGGSSDDVGADAEEKDIPGDEEAVPDWVLKSGGTYDSDEKEEAAEDVPRRVVPDWMNQSASDADEGDVDLPPWLAGAAPDVGAEDEPEAAPAASGMDWGSLSDDSLDYDDVEQDYEPQQADTPDWLSAAMPEAMGAQASEFDDRQMDDLFGEQSAGEELPDFGSLTEDLGEPSFDDLFSESEISAAPSDDFFAEMEQASSGSAGNFDDLFGDAETATATVDDDLFAEVEQSAAADVDDFDDLFGDIDTAPTATADDDDLFDELEPSAVGADDNFDALFDGTEEPQDFATELDLSAFDTSEEDLDQFFATESAPAEQAAGFETFDDEAAFDDLFADEMLDTGTRIDAAYVNQMGIGQNKQDNWFEESDTGSNLDWLQDLPDVTELDDIFAEEPQQVEAASEPLDVVPADADFLAALGRPDEIETSLPEVNLDELSFEDIDEFLSSYDGGEVDLPKTGELSLATNAELDQLFDTGDFDALEQADMDEETGMRTLSPDSPEWLAGISVSVGKESAAALVRKRDDRPLEDLSDRLQALHDRGLDMGAPAAQEQKSDVMETLLPGMADALAPAPIRPVAPEVTGAVSALALTAEQRERAALLKTLVGVGSGGLPATGDFDWAADSAAVESAKATPRARTKRRESRIRVDRLLISLLLMVAVLAPFVLRGFKLGELPFRSFAFDSRQQAAFNRIDALQPGDLVLIGVEYGPTGAAELDAAANALLHHILMRGARPLLVGGNAVGLLHVSNIISDIGRGNDAPFLAQLGRTTPFEANQDYYIVRYLPGGVVGLRSLSQDVSGALDTDIKGDTTNLNVRSIGDFALIIIIAENAEDTRAWAEQVGSAAGASLISVTGFAASPLSEPYTDAGLVGYRDAYTYERMLSVMLYGDFEEPIEPPTTIAPTDTPIGTTQEGVIPETTAAVGDETEELVTAISVTRTVPPTFTPQPPTDTPSPTATATFIPTDTPTNTPSPTTTFTPTATPLPIAVVNSQQAINVRSGPGTTFAPVGSLTPGTRVLVIGQNEDGTWLNILLDNGDNGWVSAQLLSIEPTPTPGAFSASDDDATPTPEGGAFNLPHRGDILGRPNSDRSRIEFSLQTTEEPTLEVEASEMPALTEATPEVTPIILSGGDAAAVVGVRPEIPYKDERWYAMTAGLAVIVLVIAAGNLFNIIRFVFRRGRS